MFEAAQLVVFGLVLAGLAGVRITDQGARAMAQLASAVVEPVKSDVATRSQQSANGIVNALTAILGAFPDATPPAKPRLLEGDMTALINSVNEFSEGF